MTTPIADSIPESLPSKEELHPATGRLPRPGYYRFKMVIAFDGSRYAGWQFQLSGLAVQQCVEEALKKLFPGSLGVHGCSRTDAGVHALALVAHADVPKKEFRIPTQKLTLALNAHLPEDIRIQQVLRCPQDFHAQYHTTAKEYRYQVWNHAGMNPLLQNRVWHVPRKLDLEAMRRAAKFLEGRRDFRSFACVHNEWIDNTVRTIHCCRIQRRGHHLTFVIRGDGFLYKMCRSMVGTLVQVGLGRFTPEAVQSMLQEKNRESAGMSAPAHGLTLWKVWYGNEKTRRAD